MDLKKILSNKRNLLILVGIIILVVIIVVAVIAAVSVNNKTTDEPSSEETTSLEDSLKEITSNYYENTYYVGLQDDGKAKLSLFSETGINLDLNNLNNTSKFDDEITTELSNRKCDYEKSKVWIYPTEPYGQTDYTVKVTLSCEK